MYKNNTTEPRKGVQAMSKKEHFGLAAIVALTAFALLVIGLTVTSPSFGDGPVSLRGEKNIDEANDVNDIHSIDQSGRVTKAYRQQPPLIPHRVDKYQIDLKVNQCMRCHDWPNNVAENAPKISETHYRDREGVALNQVYGGRWFCTQCHVPQTKKQAIVSNTFEPARSGK
jgi:nitrate reductase (cytochrome), electron transfer subunit